MNNAVDGVRFFNAVTIGAKFGHDVEDTSPAAQLMANYSETVDRAAKMSGRTTLGEETKEAIKRFTQNFGTTLRAADIPADVLKEYLVTALAGLTIAQVTLDTNGMHAKMTAEELAVATDANGKTLSHKGAASLVVGATMSKGASVALSNTVKGLLGEMAKNGHITGYGKPS